MSYTTIYADAVEDFVTRGAVPTLGELARLEQLKAEHDRWETRRDSSWSLDPLPMFREYSPVSAVVL